MQSREDSSSRKMDNLLAIQLNGHSRALYNRVHPITNRQQDGSWLCHPAFPKTVRRFLMLNGEKVFKKRYVVLTDLGRESDDDLGSLCRFYNVDVTSHIERAESFDSFTTEVNVTDPVIIHIHRDAVLQALAAKFGLSRNERQLSYL